MQPIRHDNVFEYALSQSMVASSKLFSRCCLFTPGSVHRSSEFHLVLLQMSPILGSFHFAILVLRFYVVILSREAASSAEAPGVMSGANGTWRFCVSTKVGSFEDATTNETSSVLFILFAWDQPIFLDHSCKLIFK